MGPHAVSSLPPYVKWILELLSEEKSEEVASNSILLNSLILSIQKLMETFGGFLNPYYKDFVISTCSLNKMFRNTADGDQLKQGASRVK